VNKKIEKRGKQRENDGWSYIWAKEALAQQNKYHAIHASRVFVIFASSSLETASSVQTIRWITMVQPPLHREDRGKTNTLWHSIAIEYPNIDDSHRQNSGALAWSSFFPFALFFALFWM